MVFAKKNLKRTDVKSEKYNARMEGKLLVLGNIGNRFHQINVEKKRRKEYIRGLKNILKMKLSRRNLIKGIKISGTLILAWAFENIFNSPRQLEFRETIETIQTTLQLKSVRIPRIYTRTWSDLLSFRHQYKQE